MNKLSAVAASLVVLLGAIPARGAKGGTPCVDG
jgi:hypothetical protein